MRPRVAIVHDWLVVRGGAERVLQEIIEVFPEADLFCVVDFLPQDQRAFLKGKAPKVTFIQRMPFASKRYRSYLPFMPIAIEQLDLSAYDLVISSSYAVAKGVITGPDQMHISYVHSPVRYAWDLQNTYLREAGLASGVKSAFARLLLHYIRLWDYRTAGGADVMVANSEFIARRIKKVYRRDAVVIHPPVDVHKFALCEQKDEFYVTASRMVPYKRIPAIVEAFAQMPERQLVVIGDGPDMQAVKTAAAKNVRILGFQPDNVLIDYMQRAKAFVFAAEEDFGIVPLEAQACGTPVIAFGKGGALETVNGPSQHSQTGVFFFEQTPESIADAVRRFELMNGVITPAACRAKAEQFAPEVFRARFRELIDHHALHGLSLRRAA